MLMLLVSLEKESFQEQIKALLMDDFREHCLKRPPSNALFFVLFLRTKPSDSMLLSILTSLSF